MSAHPGRADALLALVILALCTASVATRADAQSWAFTVALIAPLAWRRRSPWWVFVTIAAVAFAQWIADVNLLADASLLIALYTVAVYETRTRVRLAVIVLEAGVVLAALRWSSGFVPFVFLTGMAAAALFLGLNVRTRRAYMASLEQRATAAERARIAREMHDIVAHNLSVMVALADGAGYLAESDPARSVHAMQEVSRTGRDALAEMRRMLGVLRDGETAALAPQPGLGELEPLLERVRAAGLGITLELTGSPIALGSGTELTVYRLVQEALTNTLKHAGPDAHATVRLRYEADGIDVEVTDDGAGLGRIAASGQGLSGMRERAAVYGGAVEAGPGAAGGWRVHARLRGAT